MKEMISAEELASAYNKQKELVAYQLKNKTIGGYKAAVSSKTAQQNLGLPTLISGVLLAEGEVKNNNTIDLSSFKLAKIETEIGYRLSEDIIKYTTPESIKGMVAEVLPVFEVPDVTSENPDKDQITDVIAKNGFSSHYVVGDAVEVNKVDPNGIVAKLFFNDELINTGNATDAMDNQWEALSVAINLSLDHGYTPRKGNLVITGALGNILVIEKGVYTADYGALGKLRLVVE